MYPEDYLKDKLSKLNDRIKDENFCTWTVIDVDCDVDEESYKIADTSTMIMYSCIKSIAVRDIGSVSNNMVCPVCGRPVKFISYVEYLKERVEKQHKVESELNAYCDKKYV